MKLQLKQRVRMWLTDRGHDQLWLAREVRIAPSYLTQLLAGQRTPSLPVAVALEDVLRIPAREFLPRRAVKRSAKRLAKSAA